MKYAWWASLNELSRPDWRPVSAPQTARLNFDWSGKTLVPGAESLAIIGSGFQAAWVRWWHIRGRKTIRLQGSWTRLKPSQLSSDIESNLDAGKRFRRLIELATDQHRAFWVEGDQESKENTADFSSLSRYARMLIWLDPPKARHSVLELGFDSSRGRLNELDREVYLRALHQLRDELCSLMSEIPPRTPISPSIAFENIQAHPRAAQPAEISIAAITELASILNASRLETIQKIEGQLASLEGARLETLEGNQLLAKSLHRLLDSHGFRLRCPECGQAAIMRCLAAGNSHSGSFVFDHVLTHGRTFHGGRSSIPKLEVMAKPARQSKTLR